MPLYLVVVGSADLGFVTLREDLAIQLSRARVPLRIETRAVVKRFLCSDSGR